MSVGKFGENTGGKTVSHPLLTACSRRKKKVKKKFLCSTPVPTMAMLIITPFIGLRALPVVNNIAR